MSLPLSPAPMSRDEMIAALGLALDDLNFRGGEEDARESIHAVLAALRATPEGTPQTAAPVTDAAAVLSGLLDDLERIEGPVLPKYREALAVLSAAPPPPAGYTPETWARFCALSAAPPAPTPLQGDSMDTLQATRERFEHCSRETLLMVIDDLSRTDSAAPAPVGAPRHPVFSLENAFDHENGCPAPDYKGACTCPPSAPAPDACACGHHRDLHRGACQLALCDCREYVAAPAPTGAPADLVALVLKWQEADAEHVSDGEPTYGRVLDALDKAEADLLAWHPAAPALPPDEVR